MLSPSPRVFLDESPFPYSFTPQCQRGLSNPFDFTHHHIHQTKPTLPSTPRSSYLSSSASLFSHPHGCCLHPLPRGTSTTAKTTTNPSSSSRLLRPSPSLSRRAAGIRPAEADSKASSSSQSHRRHHRCQSQIPSSNHPASSMMLNNNASSCPYCAAAAVVVVDVPPSSWSSSPPPLSALRCHHYRRQISSSPSGSPHRRLIAERIFSLEDRQPSFLSTPLHALPPPSPPAPSPPLAPPPPPPAPLLTPPTPPPAPPHVLAHSLPLTSPPNTYDNMDGRGRKTNRQTGCAIANIVTRAPVTRAPSSSTGLLFGHDDVKTTRCNTVYPVVDSTDVKTTRCNTVYPVVDSTDVKTTRCNTVHPVVDSTDVKTTCCNTVHPIVQSGRVESDGNVDERPTEAAAAASILDSMELCGAKNLALCSGAALGLPSPPSADSSFGSLEVIHFPYPNKGDEEEQAPLRNRSLSVAAEDDFSEKKRKKSLGNFIVADSTPSRWTFP